MIATMNATRRALTQDLGIVQKTSVVSSPTLVPNHKLRAAIPPAFRSAARLFLPIACLAMASCFPMGVPEHFSEAEKLSDTPYRSLSAHSSAANPVTILIRPPISTENRDREIIGHQYLLGIFPVTRLYFEHSASDLLYELLLDELQLRGFTVYELPQNTTVIPNALSGYEPVFHFTLNDFRVNAFDAIFLRLLSVSGTLQGELIDNSSTAPTARARDVIPIDEKVPRSQGYAPSLLALAITSIRTGITHGLASLLPHQKRRVQNFTPPSLDHESPSLLVFNPPLLERSGDLGGTFEQNLGASITASYGFGPEPAISEKMLRRILQRGASQATIPGTQPLLPTSTLAHLRHASGDTIWSINARYRIVPPQVSAKLPLSVSAHLTLSELPGSGSPDIRAPLAEANCSVAEPLPTERDGYLVVALEQAAQKITAAFLNGKLSAKNDTPRSSGVVCDFIETKVHG